MYFFFLNLELKRTVKIKKKNKWTLNAVKDCVNYVYFYIWIYFEYCIELFIYVCFESGRLLITQIQNSHYDFGLKDFLILKVWANSSTNFTHCICELLRTLFHDKKLWKLWIVILFQMESFKKILLDQFQTHAYVCKHRIQVWRQCHGLCTETFSFVRNLEEINITMVKYLNFFHKIIESITFY